MSYRPKEWKNPWDEDGYCPDDRNVVFEVGADAMLDGIRAEASCLTIKGLTVKGECLPGTDVPGRWYFIPDDKE